jgi:LPXTG-motif cell wall-anchored protein
MRRELWFEKEEAHWSNERTLLSHVRTGLTAIALGLGVLNFITKSPLSLYVGTTFMLVGIFFLGLGPFYFVRRKRDINRF